MIPRPSHLIPLAALLLAACGTFLEPRAQEAGPSIQTDQLEYTLHETENGLETSISYQFTNQTGRTVYVVNCNGGSSIVLEKQVDGEWVGVLAPPMLACLSPPIVIQPGETHAGELRTLGRPSAALLPGSSIDEIEGTYRLHWSALVHSYDASRGNSGFGDPVPLAAKVSNSFTLRVE